MFTIVLLDPIKNIYTATLYTTLVELLNLFTGIICTRFLKWLNRKRLLKTDEKILDLMIR